MPRRLFDIYHVYGFVFDKIEVNKYYKDKVQAIESIRDKFNSSKISIRHERHDGINDRIILTRHTGEMDELKLDKIRLKSSASKRNYDFSK